MQENTYSAARAALPADAKWSCSFGYPGEGGFAEFYRTPDGARWIIDNGPWCGPETWSCRIDRPATEG